MRAGTVSSRHSSILVLPRSAVRRLLGRSIEPMLGNGDDSQAFYLFRRLHSGNQD
jgi:hypothetical protein